MAELVKLSAIEAADAKDLAEQFLVTAQDAVITEQNERSRKLQVERETRKIRERYFKLAQKTYEKVWRTCQLTRPGHLFNKTVDVGGATLSACSVCGAFFTGYKTTDPSTGFVVVDQQLVDAANRQTIAQITALQEKLIQADEEAGQIFWPV